MNYKKIALILAVLFVSTMVQAKVEKKKVKDFKHGGDFRYRYQLEDKDKDSNPQRVRNRIRFRYGGSATLDKKTSVHAGIATGAATPKSGNQTLQDSSSSKAVYLDYAYANMSTGYGNWMMGKLKNPLYAVSDMMWDTDIRPEGIAFKYKNKKAGYGLVAGYFILDEISGSDYDPNMFAVQAGKRLNLNKNTMVKVVGSVYSFDNTAGRALSYSAMTNTGTVDTINGTNAYAYNPHIVSFGSIVVFKNLKTINNISLSGEYNTNTAVDDENISALVGIGVGSSKINKKGKWKVKGNYRHIQKDGLVDILTDADTFGGATNVKGIELILQYGICHNVVLGLDYISMKELTTDQQENILQTDISIKF
ncbi:hypothetical protein DID80_03025 [Candidatus Marinamargulisbacteria bacterium SCGC AAA071-K20]|nr:hypothetical protein DID80_03025 [Candidatus Marinamargulisbacteria bacterium SCGC AAA071-K20]